MLIKDMSGIRILRWNFGITPIIFRSNLGEVLVLLIPTKGVILMGLVTCGAMYGDTIKPK
jgi:hypothetical protein